ncbi:MAG TPA: hypothetical protein VF273_12690, partial [Pelobium sp.]
MKKTILYFLAILAFAACNSDTKSGNAMGDSSKTLETADALPPAQPMQLFDVPWAAVLDSTSQKITMTQTAEVKTEDLNVNNV